MNCFKLPAAIVGGTVALHASFTLIPGARLVVLGRPRVEAPRGELLPQSRVPRLSPHDCVDPLLRPSRYRFLIQFSE